MPNVHAVQRTDKALTVGGLSIEEVLAQPGQRSFVTIHLLGTAWAPGRSESLSLRERDGAERRVRVRMRKCLGMPALIRPSGPPSPEGRRTRPRFFASQRAE